MNFKLIETQPELDHMAKKLAYESVVALDVESASNLHHYLNRVCLLQLATRSAVFIVDALRPLEFAPIGHILEDADIEIVMHDTDFDLRSLDRDYGWRPRNLFDTLIAARLCGHKEFGLAALREKYFGTRGSKKYQRADWTVRPLQPDLLRYAAADVSDLIELRDLLAAELDRLGRTKWARAEFEHCESIRFKPDERPLFARVKKARELCNGQELAIIDELARLRDDIAREFDLPLFKVMGDESLVSLARRPPQTIDDLAMWRGLHPACKKGKYAKRLIEAVQAGLKAPKLKWPSKKGGVWRGEHSLSVLADLKSWRTNYAAKLGVDPDLVLSMDSMKRLAGGQPLDEVLAAEPVSKWRGDEIKDQLRSLTPEKSIARS